MSMIPVTRSTLTNIYNYVQNFSVSSQYPSVDNPNEYFRDERNEAIQAVRNFTKGHVKKDGIGNTVSGNRSKIVILKQLNQRTLKFIFNHDNVFFTRRNPQTTTNLTPAMKVLILPWTNL